MAEECSEDTLGQFSEEWMMVLEKDKKISLLRKYRICSK